MNTFTLRSGEVVTARDPDYPSTYTNRTQAQKAADKIPGAEVIQRGRPFYVRLPTPPDDDEAICQDIDEVLRQLAIERPDLVITAGISAKDLEAEEPS